MKEVGYDDPEKSVGYSDFYHPVVRIWWAGPMPILFFVDTGKVTLPRVSLMLTHLWPNFYITYLN